ncbi:tRNA (adenine-57, 58-N(1)-) methyltransferase [Staphylothermus marinus F1]|uniref:tRNA (Adenine-57, 58-N(1)-) methyltransferase n=1 Tax=Staphylothermus marinus (strain ATCC 43588 / DSM 3639 / JCM 9404 / F1) TaxID=399550 RepID=A3DMW7_STAMF|nr:tRNA (adenine-N1)-methyltransferase [Staphylothermus marinus]ABN69977.1 tRNA (adenine-57, 58-N(1)-) methyltransferase [Staphylothermus marinus F1]
MSVNNSLNYGDLALIYIDSKRKYLVKLEEGKILGTDKGFIKHEDIIGKKYGDIIYTNRNVKAYILKPLLIDLLQGLKRVTQIIYPKDSSLMIYLSSITPGSLVLEAGVGSGFLTASLANFVGDSGKIIGFDIREDHLLKASENLEKLGFDRRVELILGDIREESIVVDEVFDAVFYDLPDPWNALNTAYRALKPSSPILIYVPTVNQIEKTVLSMREHGGFIDIHVYEVLLREYSVEKNATRPYTLMIGHTGYIVFARKISA